MITEVVIENFKRFRKQSFSLEDSIVLAGPNNTGKSTLLQALATWSMSLDRWRQGKGKTGKAKKRAGTPLTRKDFTALPLREFDLLWRERSTALSKGELAHGKALGEPRLIHIEVKGAEGLQKNDPWALTMELRYQGPEQIYVKPIPGEGDVPQQALDLTIVHCPPFSGIGAEERRLDRGAQNLEIGRGKPGEIIRNLLFEVSEQEEAWNQLVEDIQELFRVTLLKPDYDSQFTAFIRCEYLDGIPQGKGKEKMVLRLSISLPGAVGSCRCCCCCPIFMPDLRLFSSWTNPMLIFT